MADNNIRGAVICQPHDLLSDLKTRRYPDLTSLRSARAAALTAAQSSTQSVNKFTAKMQQAFTVQFEPGIAALKSVPAGGAYRQIAERAERAKFKKHRREAAEAENLRAHAKTLQGIADTARNSKHIFSDTKAMLDNATLLSPKRAELFQQLKGSDSASLERYAREALRLRATDPEGARALAATVAQLVSRLPSQHRWDTKPLTDAFYGEDSAEALRLIDEIESDMVRVRNELHEAIEGEPSASSSRDKIAAGLKKRDMGGE